MTTEFGKSGDTGQKEDEGTNFGQTLDDGKVDDATENKGLTPEEIEALRTRDTAAQQHIPELESENKELRDEVVKLQDELANATTLEGVMERISSGGKDQAIDATVVTQIVDRALQQRQTEDKQESNFETVVATLTKTYGDWKTADTKVQERALELDIKLEDATTMARNNPKAFLQLFNPQTTTTTDQSSGVRSAGSGQTVVGEVTTGDTRDAAYYNNMRKTKPKLYWSVEMQAQYRRDIHNIE